MEPYANNNYEVLDNFLFDKLDSISDEASNSREGDIPIILIATDRREKGDSLLVKLFGIGIYNVLLGQDRKIDNVCKLIYQPRTKKEAKAYYRVESDEIEYQSVDPDSVSETEIQNIIRHYKKLGKDESRYVESFNDIAAQYTDTQLKLITKFLPLNVRAVLEERCPKYQQVMIGSVKNQIAAQASSNKKYTARDIQSKNINKIDLIDRELQKAKLTKPVVIPSTINMQNVKKAYDKTETELTDSVPKIEEEPIVEKVKKGRGRPRKEKAPEELVTEEPKVKKGRGRPKKVVEQPETTVESAANDIDLFGLATDDSSLSDLDDSNNTIPPRNEEPENNESNNNMRPNDVHVQSDNAQPDNTMGNYFFGNDFSSDEYNDDFLNNDLPLNELPGMDSFNPVSNNQTQNIQNVSPSVGNANLNTQYTPNMDYTYNRNQQVNINNKPVGTDNTVNNNSANLITGEKKIVAFVGTSKNGTSFLVNNLAADLSGKGINTAILDLTKNKNAYYIYTQNEDRLRDKAFKCIEGLRSGVADGIQVNKNLTVYTTLPGENPNFEDYANILDTLVKNYSLILLDCDLNTNLNYFASSQEIYLVQTYDILTIQPLTEFLNEMKYKNILDPNRLRIVINKTLRLRKLTDQMIIGGISCYNDPASTYINTLFDKDRVIYTTIPFEDQTYARYLERLVDCEISLNGYSKLFLDALEKLSNMVYPLIASNTKNTQPKNYNDYSRKNTKFNSNMNATLNKMRNNF